MLQGPAAQDSSSLSNSSLQGYNLSDLNDLRTVERHAGELVDHSAVSPSVPNLALLKGAHQDYFKLRRLAIFLVVGKGSRKLAVIDAPSSECSVHAHHGNISRYGTDMV